MQKRVFLLIIAFVLLWNSGFIGAEYGLLYAGTFTLMFWRYLILSAVLFLYLQLKGTLRWIGWHQAVLHMIIGILAHGVWLSCVLLALERKIPAGVVALVVALQPLATGAFSGLLAGENTSAQKWLGLIIGFVGVAISVIFRMDFKEPSSVFGYLIPLGAVISITVANLLQRRMELSSNTNKIPVDLSMLYQSFATTMVMILPAFILEGFYMKIEMPFIYTMGWLIFAVSLGGYALMWLLLQRMDATRVASLFYLGPPVTMLMAWVSFGDSPQVTDIVGLVVIFIGVLLTQIDRRKIRRFSWNNRKSDASF